MLQMVLCLALLLFGILGSGLTVFAEPDTLTLDQAVRMALKADYQIKAAMNDLEVAKLAVRNEAVKIFPKADIGGQYRYQAANDTYPTPFRLSSKRQFQLPGIYTVKTSSPVSPRPVGIK